MEFRLSLVLVDGRDENWRLGKGATNHGQMVCGILYLTRGSSRLARSQLAADPSTVVPANVRAHTYPMANKGRGVHRYDNSVTQGIPA